MISSAFFQKTFALVLIGLPAIGLPLNAAVSAQNPSERQPFRIRTDAVPVDVVAIDKDGKPALGLTKDDFEIIEDGAAQEIIYFSESNPSVRTSAMAEKSRVEREATQTIRPAPQPIPIQPRHFLFLLGNIGYDYFESIPDVADFVEKLRPEDRVAAMAFERVTAFTTDHGRIARMLRNYSKVNQRIHSILRHRRSHGFLWSSATGGRMPDSAQRAIQEFFEESGLRTRRLSEPVFRNVAAPQLSGLGLEGLTENHAVQGLLEEQLADPRLIPPGQNGLREFFQSGSSDQLSGLNRFDQARLKLITDLPLGVAAQIEDVSLQDFGQLRAATEYLAFLNGEKHLFFFNESGLLLQSSEELETISRLAADNRVRLHLFQTGGSPVSLEPPFVSYLGGPQLDMLVNPPRPQLWRFPTQATRRLTKGNLEQALALSSLRKLAHETGSQASIHGDVAADLQRALEQIDFKYELAYFSANPDWDGRFRRIEVRVKRPGVRLLHRRGYWALPTRSEATRRSSLALMRTVSALKEPRFLQEMPLQLTVSRFKGEGDADLLDVRVGARLPEPSLRSALLAKNPGEGAGLTIGYFLIQDGDVSSSLDSLEFTLSESQYRTALKDGLQLGKTLEAPKDLTGAFLKVVVYDAVNDYVASVGAALP